MTCRLAGAKPLSESMLEYCLLDPSEKNSSKFIRKWRQEIGGYFDSD